MVVEASSESRPDPPATPRSIFVTDPDSIEAVSGVSGPALMTEDSHRGAALDGVTEDDDTSAGEDNEGPERRFELDVL